MLCNKCGVDDLRNFVRTIFRQDGNDIYAYHLGKCTECGADILEKEIFNSEGYANTISMETFLEENPDFSFEKEKVEKSSKLIIHETDSHGCGQVYYNGKTDWYAYDDEKGDIRAAVDYLIELGFIDKEQVLIFEGGEIYQKLGELLERE